MQIQKLTVHVGAGEVDEWIRELVNTHLGSNLVSDYSLEIRTRVIDDHEPCCWCGRDNDGIYYRGDPAKVPCGGEHAEG
jgi:hypothetical protein